METINTDNKNYLNNFLCPNCNRVPFFKLEYKEMEPILIKECKCSEIKTESLSDFLSKKNEFKCNKCNEVFDSPINLLFCVKCQQNFCPNHHDIHKNDLYSQHIVYSLCNEHKKYYCGYCFQCEKNICPQCINSHHLHYRANFINLNEEILNFDFSNQLEKTKNALKKMKETKNYMLEILENTKKEIINVFEKYQKINDDELQLTELLLNFYEFNYKKSTLNYQIFHNIINLLYFNNLDFMFKSPEDIKEITPNKFLNYIKDKSNYLLKETIKKNIMLKPFSNYTFQESLISINGAWNTCLLILQDLRIALGSDADIFILSKNDFKIDLKIHEFERTINYLIQLPDSRIVASSAEEVIKIFKLTSLKKYIVDCILTGHNGNIYKVLSLNNNKLASCSVDKRVKIWCKVPKKKFICETTIEAHNGVIIAILELTKNRLVTCCHDEHSLKFWNYETCILLYSLNDISFGSWNGIITKINNDVIAVVGREITFINTNNYQIISILTIERMLCFCKLDDENYLVGGRNKIVQFEFKNNIARKVCEKEKAHEERISSIISLSDGSIISNGLDDTTKLWK